MLNDLSTGKRAPVRDLLFLPETTGGWEGKRRRQRDTHCGSPRSCPMPFADPEKRRDWAKRHYESGKNAEYVKRWQSRNPEYQAQWKAANQEKVREYKRRWREKHPFLGKLFGKKKAERLAELKTHCRMCGATGELHLDHILPRSRGGSDKMENLQWLCPPCNTAKGVFTPDEFLNHIRKILLRSGG
jgi:5-methylcytosine-specific restriction endonuclease McrA